ncbi:MAG: primary-amine oxidase [Bdellovibrionota bacterium]
MKKSAVALAFLFSLICARESAAMHPITQSKRKPSRIVVSPVAIHPLDPLTKEEIQSAKAILLKAGKISKDNNVLFPYLMLKEPPKKEVLAWKSGPFRREAFAELYDRKAGKLYEATVDLRANRVADYHEVVGMHPSVMLSEFSDVPPIVKADPRFAEAMHRRGITNLDDVAVDIWAYGSPTSDPLTHTQRLLRAIAYMKGKGTNFYARPIDGFTAVVDLTEKKVIQVVDTAVLPVPPDSADFDAASINKLVGGSTRPPLKPLKITQPQGVSFSIRGHEVRWQNWSFHYAMHPREGLVIYLVRYNDHGTWRPVMYRGSLSDMMVPYGHPDQHWTYRAAFDEGEYGIGRYSGSLNLGVDVPENAVAFPAVFADDFGNTESSTVNNAVAIWERDGGLLWKHYDMYQTPPVNVSRRGRELAIGFITTISNYDYGFNWIFKQDGSLELEVVLSGIMLAKGSEATMASHDHSHGPSDLMFGHLVAPNVVAPHHQHFFSMRLDMDVDGQANNVAEIANQAVPPGADNPANNAFYMTETPLKSELGAVRDLDFDSQRKWIIYNSASHTEHLGYPRGFILIPGENAKPYLQPDSPLLTRGGFVKHQVWFTQENDGEMNAAGPYPLQRAESAGLPEWVKQDRSLENQDVVLWYNFCVSHAPRPEEWPVMTVHKTGFQLVPAGFFDRNPALDVR